MQIQCRSPQTILEDDVFEAIALCDEVLNGWTYAGVCSGYTYGPTVRKLFKEYKTKLEAMVLSGEVHWPRHTGVLGWAAYLRMVLTTTPFERRYRL